MCRFIGFFLKKAPCFFVIIGYFLSVNFFKIYDGFFIVVRGLVVSFSIYTSFNEVFTIVLTNNN